MIGDLVRLVRLDVRTSRSIAGSCHDGRGHFVDVLDQHRHIVGELHILGLRCSHHHDLIARRQAGFHEALRGLLNRLQKSRKKVQIIEA